MSHPNKERIEQFMFELYGEITEFSRSKDEFRQYSLMIAERIFEEEIKFVRKTYAMAESLKIKPGNKEYEPFLRTSLASKQSWDDIALDVLSIQRSRYFFG